MRGDLDRASELLPSIPKEHHNRCVQSFQVMENGNFLLILKEFLLMFYIWLFGHTYISFDRPEHSLLQRCLLNCFKVVALKICQ